MQTISAAYPKLHELSVVNNRSLDTHATQPGSVRELQNLFTCAWQIINGAERQDGVPDSYGYFHTIESFLSMFDEEVAPRKKLWTKLSNSNGSTFLDTVCEMALAIDLHQKKVQLKLEVPFGKVNGGNRKDADIVVGEPSASRVWIDVRAIQPKTEVIDEFSVYPNLSPSEVVSTIAERASQKFNDKFADAVAAGELSTDQTAVMICLLKWETALIYFVVGLPPPAPPDGFWETNRGLDLVYAYTMRKGQGDLLVPVPLCRWICQTQKHEKDQ